MSRARGFTALLVVVAPLALAGLAAAWDSAQKIDAIGGNSTELNTPSQDGCPIQSPDGLSLYIASNRPGGKGGLDIWMACRTSTTAPWGAPAEPRRARNSAADDFCPTPVGKNGLFFVSREALPGACGQGDIYFTHRTRSQRGPSRSGCSAPSRPELGARRAGPVVGRPERQAPRQEDPVLLAEFGDPERRRRDLREREAEWSSLRAAAAVSELNDAAANDIQPNVRADGLEVVFSSNRSGGLGAQDSGRRRVLPSEIPGPPRSIWVRS